MRTAFAALTFAWTGCGGSAETSEDASADDETASPNDGTGTGSDDEGDPEPTELRAPTTRFFRLTHQQWENTMQDLFWLAQPSGLSDDFRADPHESGYLFDNAIGLEVDESLWNGYRTAAAAMAEIAVADPELREALIPDSGGGDAVLADAFVAEFGVRAFRRPLADEEHATYRRLFDSGPEMYREMRVFDAGMRVIIETMLQSPHFVYRVESSTQVDSPVIELNGYEIASRLSYFLRDSMPDTELFTAAAAGELETTAGIQAQALRLLEEPRALTVLQEFHDKVFEIHKVAGIAPSSNFFPDAPEDLHALALEEFHRFIRDGVYASGGGVHELLLSNESFINEDLATIYGIQGSFGPDFVRAQLPRGERRGILTQIGFLATHASSVHPDPIHRGKFILERITCTPLPPPPDNIPTLPIVDGQTNREAIENLTQQPGSECAGCHLIINPFGFPFENYDAIGGFRSLDNGLPVDSTSTVLLDGDRFAADNAFELIDALARSRSVHECYARQWVEFVNGRPSVESDQAFIERLGEASLAGLSLKDILLDIVTSPSFRTRSVQELE